LTGLFKTQANAKLRSLEAVLGAAQASLPTVTTRLQAHGKSRAFRIRFGNGKTAKIAGMLSRTESIDGFHLKLSRVLYEEFLKTEEAEKSFH